jgi:very-short-patch-repair endonuclease
LAERAQRQHGVVSARQLAEFGYAKATISSAVKRARLHQVYRGVYAVGHRALTWEGWVMAAVLARPGSVASHVTAGWAHGLLRSQPDTIHLTAATRQRLKRDFVVHFARLEPEDVTSVDGIPVTSPARTVLDLAPNPRRDLAKLLQRADDLSDLERRFRRLVLAAGLQTPQTNVVVEGYELDAYWEAEGFAVELETYATHGSPTSFEEDPRRHDDLLLAGIELIRVSDVRLEREPRETIERVAAHLERRRHAIRPRRSVA